VSIGGAAGRVGLNVGLYVLASMIFFADLIDLLVRLYLRRQNTGPTPQTLSPATSVRIDVGTFTPYQMRLHLRPFAIVASVHNASKHLDEFLVGMRDLRDHLWIIDDASTDDTVQRLRAAGVRFVRNPTNGRKPAALQALLRMIPSHIETIMVLDPDTRILSDDDDFVRVLFEFQRSGMAALCPRVAAAGSGWLARIQRLEYWLAFSIGRKSLSDFSITSGVAVYRADALRFVLEEHSLSVYAEDLENALILLAQQESIYYDGRLVVETDAIAGIRRLFSQRVGWHFGLMRVYAARWKSLWSRSAAHIGFAYQFIVYMGVLTLLLHPFKIAAFVLLVSSFLSDAAYLVGGGAFVDLANPLYFPIVYLQYVGLIFFALMVAVPLRERRGVLAAVPLYPIYAILHVIPATIGYLNWVAMRLWGRRVYRDHYEPALP
jgi:cellulose synthase/poly-beta-1,6-N-acetylglucosamine synthase-like glycosyltransferase